MPYPSAELLAQAATGLRGAHNFVVASIPALLSEAKREGHAATELTKFGSAAERSVLDRSFQLGTGDKPYLTVWSEPPGWVDDDFSRRTIQAQRTRDAFARDVFIDDSVDGGRRTMFALKPDAGMALLTKSRTVKLVDLALWLGRTVDFDDIDAVVRWFHDNYPDAGTDLIGTVYDDDVPDDYRAPEMWSDTAPSTVEILDRLGVQPERARRGARAQSAAPQGQAGFEWTRELVSAALKVPDVDAIAARVQADLTAENIVLPDSARLIRRCVVAILAGHLILQGPPGTGKTTLARTLARAFSCDLDESTATSEWSAYDVVGGYRTGPDGLVGHHGCVTRAVLQCAEVMRSAQAESAAQPSSAQPPATPLPGTQSPPNGAGPQGVWLLIDEFNRADIDRAIGSLYTLLGSNDPGNLASSPLDLWFEEADNRKRMWVPGRFRLIGSMNDVDTSYLNRISQGLTRRFGFITVGVNQDGPTEDTPVTDEVRTSLVQAAGWIDRVYGQARLPFPATDLETELREQLVTLSALVDAVRAPAAGPGWPVGTAQVVDVLRSLLLNLPNPDRAGCLDLAVADRLIPQMGALEQTQFEQFGRRLTALGLTTAATELAHLLDPHVV